MASINQQGAMDVEMGLPPAPHPIPNMNSGTGEPSPSPSPRAPALVVSHSSKALIPSHSSKALIPSSSSKALIPSSSSKALFVSNSGRQLLLSNSGKRMDPLGKKKYVKQVTGRHNDTELHLAAQRGDVGAVRDILGEIDAQMLKTMSGAEFDAEVAEIREAMVNEVNELGETALFTAAERGHIDVVKELLPYSTKEGITAKNRSGLDPLHVAANQGHQAIVKLLLEHDEELSKTVGQSNATPLVSAATKGHTAVVHELLSKDSSLIEISRSNGKNALHLSARQGHVDIVQELLDKDPQLARRTDKKGQTALHMAVKGISVEVVKLILQADPAIVMLPDKFGNTALHIATRKKRSEIVHELLSVDNINVNALTRDHKTALDIAEGLPMSEESTDLKENLTRNGACRANELNQPRDELRKTVTEIKHNVHSQLEQARKTNKNMNGIAKELHRLHREGIRDATNSVTIVASLFATVAFAAIFTVPGGDLDSGYAVASNTAPFKIFYFTNALALFTSLAVVVVQITLVRGEIKSEKRVVGVINKLMWLASVLTCLAFVSASYVVIGKKNIWAAIFCTIVGGLMMAGVLGAMTYIVLKSKRTRKMRKREKFARTRNQSFHTEISDSDYNPYFAL